DVWKSYGDLMALCGLDLKIRAGEVLSLLGPNGAGKTTTVNLLLGLAKPLQGSVRVFGCAPDHPKSRARVGAMLQISGVPQTLRVAELVELFSSYYPDPLAAKETLRIAGLEELEKRPFGELSGGQRQRVLFALSICGDPELLYLDEPTTGLDVEARRGLWQQIRTFVERGRSVVLTTHYLEEADALANRIVLLNEGRSIAEGSPSMIKARVQGRRIRCRTRLHTSEIDCIPGVKNVGSEDGLVEILTSRAEPVVRELLMRDGDLSDLEVIGAALDDAFLALTTKKEAA
ncbi:MAG: ABC transporter ATP-binding protein, partial [Thermoanaerobaculia bacterium]